MRALNSEPLDRLAQVMVLVLCFAAIAAHGASPAADLPLRVAVTLPPQAWLVERIAGQHATVQHVVGPGDSPATFQPTDAQVSKLARAVVYFRIGVPAENGPWFQALEAAGQPRVVDLRSGIAQREMVAHHHHEAEEHSHQHSHEHGENRGEGLHAEGLDPHIWLSPRRLEIMARTVARTLTEIDPARGARYESNRVRLTAELQALDRELRARLQPLAGTAFFVFHPAWGYFADDYGLQQLAIEIEGKEPSEREVTRLVRQARALDIGVIFVQPQFRMRSARTVADAVGAEVEIIDPLAVDLIANLRHVAARIVAWSAKRER